MSPRPLDTSTLGPILIDIEPHYRPGQWYCGASAPRDGTRFVGWWRSPAHPPVVAWWAEQQFGAVGKGFRISTGDTPSVRMSRAPDAWMPLPPSPTSAELGIFEVGTIDG